MRSSRSFALPNPEDAMKTLLLPCFAVVLVVAAAPAQVDIKAQLKKLQGTWKVVRVEADGKPLPAENTEGWTLTIQGGRYALRSRQEAIEGVYKLAGLEEPLAIDATRTNGADKGKTLWGIYRLEGDQLKM